LYKVFGPPNIIWHPGLKALAFDKRIGFQPAPKFARKMSEELHINKSADRETIYQSLLPQLRALVDGETDTVANVANVMAGLREAFGFFWVGCYFIKNGELVLGPFQGPVACTRIQKGKGVCGSAWEKNQVLIVPDVDLFPGHIACSSLSRSEIVVPILRNNEVIGVLDVDSDKPDDFTSTDQKYLEQVTILLSACVGE
jgi:GAF domain-containing protein